MSKRKRDKTLTIRVTENEKQYIQKRADKADLSVTDYMVRLSYEHLSIFLSICNHFY